MPMQPTAFGAQDRCFFEISLCDAPRRRLMGRPLGGRSKPCTHLWNSSTSMWTALFYTLLDARIECNRARNCYQTNRTLKEGSMESLTIFVRTTRALFDILITEFGATVIEPADPRNKIVTSVQYDLGPLRVEIWNDRGGCSLELVVKEDTPIIRPYMSHYFINPLRTRLLLHLARLTGILLLSKVHPNSRCSKHSCCSIAVRFCRATLNHWKN